MRAPWFIEYMPADRPGCERDGVRRPLSLHTNARHSQSLMGDVLLSAFYVAFGFLKPPLQFSAVHSVSSPSQRKAPRNGGAEV